MPRFAFFTLRFIWRKLTPHTAKRLMLPLIHSSYRIWVSMRAASKLTPKQQLMQAFHPKPGPLVISGFFDEPLGIGRAGHCTLKALEQGGYSPIAHAIRPLLNGHSANTVHLPGDAEGGVYLMHCNAPEAEILLTVLSVDSLKYKYRIGYWAYELPQAPKSWLKVSKLFHEIWVPSHFVKQSLAKAHCPVRVMPHPVLASLPSVYADRPAFGLDPAKFWVFAAGDLRSSSYRKNLMGAIAIYLQAFPKESPHCGLILKISFTEEDTQSFQAVLTNIKHRNDITLITEHLGYDRMQQLLASCDVFLSPHRAEGFGLILAEALALNVAVLATGWSGNMEFMHGMTEALIPFSLTAVRDPSGVYGGRTDQMWAEPDINAASAMLLALYQDPALRHRLTNQGQANVQRLSDPWCTESLFPAGTLEPAPASRVTTGA